jgi:hypothetical protein
VFNAFGRDDQVKPAFSELLHQPQCVTKLRAASSPLPGLLDKIRSKIAGDDVGPSLYQSLTEEPESAANI